jgi:hemerythrin-like domain-containing protein
MLRDKNLIPLSHQHQHALALCVRIERASPISEASVGAWQAEIARLFQDEIGIHFQAEEKVLFPAAREYPQMVPLVDQLLREHADLRGRFAWAIAQKMSGLDISELAAHLAAHIRTEERQLFEALQKLMSPQELAAAGQKLDEILKEAAQSCDLPTETTRLRARQSTDY